jgi:uncharacterized protein (TIGR03000 family)
MARWCSVPLLAALATAGLFLTCEVGRAQSYDSREAVGTQFSQPFLDRGMTATRPYYTYPYSPAMNGFPMSNYTGYAQNRLPTYMTSINYPWIYGAYGYQFAPGRFALGAEQSYYTTAPTTYGADVGLDASMRANRVLPDTAQTPLNRSATIDVRLPADATLSFQGTRMNQTGQLRHFVTPPLAAGNTYTYDVAASWMENGREVSRTRNVTIRPGDRLQLDLTTVAPEESPTLRARP